jgi:hypothetical protein
MEASKLINYSAYMCRSCPCTMVHYQPSRWKVKTKEIDEDNPMNYYCNLPSCESWVQTASGVQAAQTKLHNLLQLVVSIKFTVQH